jgi:hypothetical protein
MSRFSLLGQYRVQSRRDYALSALEGKWLESAQLLDSAKVNEALSTHPLWNGRGQVALRSALISQRCGKFAFEPDILYKQDLFIPAPGSLPMENNIVDVLKSWRNWNQRRWFVQTLLGAEDYRRAVEHLSDLKVIIANEFMVHEAGHSIAYDVLSKQKDGYFAPGGKSAWPLIYLEEFRADLNAFGFAAKLLPPNQAAQLFLYNLLLRFGVHRQGILTNQSAPYGLIPYFLFCLLSERGFITAKEVAGRYRFVLGGLNTQNLIDLMLDCANHANEQLNAPEMEGRGPFDRALTAARYIQSRLRRTEDASKFALVMNQPAENMERS